MMDYAELIGAQAAALPTAGEPPWDGAVGPEVHQAGILSSRRRRALRDSPRANARLDGRPVNFADDRNLGNPQPMVTRPGLRDLATGETVPIDTALPYLPTPKPPAGWDGENDAGAPWAGDD